MKAQIILAGVLLASVSLTAMGEPRVISYKADILPISKDYCLGCHVPGGKGYEKSGPDLRSYDSLMKGTKFGTVIKPGSHLASTLNFLVSGHANPSITMPFGMKGGLPKDKVDLLNLWVEQGAKNN